MVQGESNKSANSSKHHMVGGEGPHSYLRNSEYQKQLLLSADDSIQDLISHHLDAGNPPRTFRIADFGCSVGPNAIQAVENIIKAVKIKFENSRSTPDFHVFFNDLIGSDFDTLFKNLPSPRNYFAAASPGSFHTQLFPKSTLNFAHCSTALHWLSRIPVEVTDRSSPAWNAGRIHYSGAGQAVRQAYSDQYAADMEAFLTARATELVPGGLMAVVVLGFPDGVVSSDSSIGKAFDILGSCLCDMARAGKIDEERVDSFNLPFYYPSPSELTALIEANGSYRIEKMAALAAPMRRRPDAAVLTSHLRAVIEVLVEEHFGNGVVEELFARHYEKLLKSPILVDEKFWKETNYFVFLKREEDL
ncbi:loganic acid O-methyltransferase-like [Andrographis paniculata]|uniref:loganic acid O-methyltransferase-like n=1 Tax=Andrographis paniculata TaxID=175694 RepID=UPI0021E88238|nr:loganic acid O-methyltransferase-like [Andrographis paniculata]